MHIHFKINTQAIISAGKLKRAAREVSAVPARRDSKRCENYKHRYRHKTRSTAQLIYSSAAKIAKLLKPLTTLEDSLRARLLPVNIVTPVNIVLILVCALLISTLVPSAKADLIIPPNKRMIPFYTGHILPTPQKVTYYDKQLSLDHASVIVGKGVTNPKAYINLLQARIKRRGGSLTRISSLAQAPGKGTVLILGQTTLTESLKLPAVPDRAEGYILQTAQADGHPVVVLQGHDKQGLLWAVISFNQLVSQKNGTARVRAADVVDYPYMNGRSYIMNIWWGNGSAWAQFCLQFKINHVVFASGKITRESDNWSPRGKQWRQAPPTQWLNQLEKIGHLLNPFGIDWYIGIVPIRGKPKQKINSASQKDFQAIYRIASAVAAAGGGVMLRYDDSRFPMNPAEKKHFSAPRKADAYFINKLYDKLQKNYPGTKMLFCPPFYWGPGGTTRRYGNRDKYLTAMGNKLPERIGIFWTGSTQRSTSISADSIHWIEHLIKRKPWFWQNGVGTDGHISRFSYMTDPLHFDRWYPDPAVFHQFKTFGLYSNASNFSVPEIALVERMWNPPAYDSVKTVKAATQMLVGPNTYPAMVKLNKAMTRIDPYGWQVTPAAVRDLKSIRQKVAAIQTASKKVEALSPGKAARMWTPMIHYAKVSSGWLRRLESNPNLSRYEKKIQKVKKRAKKEVGLNSSRDIFLSPYDFLGGKPARYYHYKVPKRLATWVYRGKPLQNQMFASFTIKQSPVKGPWKLVISGVDDGGGREGHCPVSIMVNHRRIFSGPFPFTSRIWSIGALSIPAGLLRQGDNQIIIKALKPAPNESGAGYFMLNYAIIKPEK